MRMITNIGVGWRAVLAAAAVVAAAVLTPALVAAAPAEPAAAEEDSGGFDVGSTFQASGEDKVQWHGYYEFHYFDQEGKNRSMDAHKITVWMGAKLNDMVFLSTEIEYEHFPRLPEGEQTQGETGVVKMDSSQLSITPWQGFRGYLGVWYVPFGLEYLSYPGFKNKLISRPKIMKSGGIIPGTWSAVGMGFNSKMGNAGQIDVYWMNGDANNGGIERDNKGGNNGKSVGARIMFDGMPGLNFGASYVSGPWGVNDLYDSTRIAAHIRADFDILLNSSMAPVFLAEWVDGEDQADSSVVVNGVVQDKTVSGYYAQLSSRLTPLIEIAARYDEYDNDELKLNNVKKEKSVGIVFHVLERFQIKMEYKVNEEEGPAVDNDLVDVEFVAWW